MRWQKIFREQEENKLIHLLKTAHLLTFSQDHSQPTFDQFCETATATSTCHWKNCFVNVFNQLNQWKMNHGKKMKQLHCFGVSAKMTCKGIHTVSSFNPLSKLSVVAFGCWPCFVQRPFPASALRLTCLLMNPVCQCDNGSAHL